MAPGPCTCGALYTHHECSARCRSPEGRASARARLPQRRGRTPVGQRLLEIQSRVLNTHATRIGHIA
eukprot:15465257-Alexandrium_andersonii.AAC.1